LDFLQVHQTRSLQPHRVTAPNKLKQNKNNKIERKVKMKTVKQMMSRCQIENISPEGKELAPERLRLVVGGLRPINPLLQPSKPPSCTAGVRMTATNVEVCPPALPGKLGSCYQTMVTDYDCSYDNLPWLNDVHLP
jgi:hypothetical protein